MKHLLRHIAPFVLLAAYLPMTVMSSLHVHHETIDADDTCHQCTGHFEAPHHHQSDCQYCHFLSLGYLGQTMEQVSILLPTAETNPTPVFAPTLQTRLGVSLLRAPPMA